MGIKEILHELHSEACKFTWDEYIEWLSTYCDDVIIRYKIKATPHNCKAVKNMV